VKKVGERQSEVAFALRDKREVVVRHIQFISDCIVNKLFLNIGRMEVAFFVGSPNA